MQKQKSKDKKWVGWFRPTGRGTKHGSLIAGTIDIVSESVRSLGARKITVGIDSPKLFPNNKRSGIRLLVVSIPSSCGIAAQRNRFRRIVKARFAKSFTREKIVGEKLISTNPPGGGSTDKSFDGKARKQGLWIRLLNQHRLGHKIRQEDWKKEFDEIEALYCRSKASL